mmetsp:Transcript_5206/g.12943  ORF Transcript_5206/g.12943 Transcript_5206/m.12943 type:complete len:385 (+) Transcript_5206:77-1231(+)
MQLWNSGGSGRPEYAHDTFLTALTPSRGLRLEGRRDALAAGFSIAEEHLRGFPEENWILQIGVTPRHGAFQEDAVPGLPNLDHGHAVDGTALVGFGGLVRDVVGADDEANVNVGHVVLRLLHFQDHLVGDTRLGEEHVHLAGHASSHGVDREFHIGALCNQGRRDVRHRALSLRDSHSVTGHDHHFARLEQQVGDSVGFGLSVLLGRFIPLLRRWGDLHASEDHVEDVTVHGIAHDLRQNRAAETDERAHNCERRTPEQHAFRDQGPTRVGVENRDATGHIATSDAANQVVPHDGREPSGRIHEARPSRDANIAAKDAEHAQLPCCHADVQEILPWEVQRRGRQVAVQFPESDQAACESDASDEIAEHRSELVAHGTMWVNHVA